MAAPATTRSVVRAIFAAFMTKSCVAAPTYLLYSGEYDAHSINTKERHKGLERCPVEFFWKVLHQALDFFGFSCAVAGPKNACIFSTSPRWHDKDQDPGQPRERNLSLEDVAE